MYMFVTWLLQIRQHLRSLLLRVNCRKRRLIVLKYSLYSYLYLEVSACAFIVIGLSPVSIKGTVIATMQMNKMEEIG